MYYTYQISKRKLMCECSKNASALPNQGCILCTRSGRSERSVLRSRFQLHQVYFLSQLKIDHDVLKLSP